MRKRITSLLLTLVMLLSLVPAMGVTASAGEMLPFHEVGTYQELIDAVHSGKPRIKLKNDINTRDVYASGIGIPEDKMITIGYDAAITLDLNGCTLALETLVRGGFSFFTVYGELEIKDSSPSQNGKITGKFPSVLASMFRTQGGTLTLQSGTLMTSSNKNDVITVGSSGGHVVINGGRICSGKWDTSSASPCGYAVLAVTDFADVEKMEVIINGGVFDGAVGFFPRSEFTCKEPRFHIYGGTFKQDVLLRCGQKTFKTHSPILEICGGSFEGGLKIYDWGMDPIDRYGDAAQSYPPFKLLGGTFSCTVDLCYEKSYWGFDSPKLDQFIGALKYERMRPVFAAMLENSAIVKPSDTYTAVNIDKGMDWALREGYGTYYQMLLKGTAANPIRIIPNAWGMKSVTLDGKEINYAKDWYGAVEEMDNSTAHTIKFTWEPLADELREAGYSYDAKCEHYISGSSAVQQTDTIDADKTSHTVTIRAGADPKVYSYDLQLNLDRNGSFVGIFSNEHIVKLVVSKAPPAPPEPPAPVAHSITVTNGRGTANPTSAMAGETVTVTAKDDTANNMMFTQWYAKTAGVTFADATQKKTTFVMPDCDVEVNPGFQQVSFTNQPTDSWLSAEDDSKVYFAFSQPITSWKLVNENDQTLASGDAADANALVAAKLILQPENTVMTCRVIVTANGQDFTSNAFTLKWYKVPGAPDVTVYPAGGKFVETLSVNLKTPSTYWEIAYTTDGSDPYDKSGTEWLLTPSAKIVDDSTQVPISKDTTIKACLYNYDGPTNMQKFGDIVTCDFTKVELTPPVADPPSGTSFYDSLNVSLSTDIVNAKIMWSDKDLDVDDLGLPGKWKEYEPEKESITLSGSYGMHGFYALTGIRMEHPDGYTYWVHSDKQDYSYPRITYATIADASVTGKVNEEINPVDVSITLSGDVFAEDLTAGTDVSGWFTNRPTGLTAKVKERTNHTKTLVITISGTPTATSAAAISVEMPKNALRYTGTGTAVEQTVLPNSKAVYNIGTDVAHTHDYTGQPYLYLDPGNHYQECTANDGYNIQPHEFTPWTDNGNDTHSRHCTVCKMTDGSTYTETANHNWQWVVDNAATPNAPGKQHEECVDCHVKRSENTEIPMLTSIMVEHLTVAKPVKDAAAAIAATADSSYTVANTEWMAADGTPLAIGGKFQPGTVYTVKITLETAGAGVFSVKSTYNTIEGKTATVSPNLTGDNHADSVILTYTFDATEGTYVPTKPAITTVALPDGKVGDAYSQTLAATGTTPITWSIETGTLPDGLTLVGDTIKGTPSKAGEFKFTVKATNGGGSDTKELTIKIADADSAKYHTVTVTSGGNGTVSANPAKAVAGTEIKLTATPNSGYHFKEWKVVKAGGVTLANETSATTTFIMPAENVEVKAIFEKNSSTGGGGGGGVTTYPITVKSAKNGDVTASHKSASKGTTVTLTVDPDKGYVLDTLTVLDGKDKEIKLTEKNGKFTFTMPASKVTVEAMFKAAGNNPFIDVPAGSYYEDAVIWAVDKGITTGTSATTFNPNGICTRAQAVTFLWRAAGSPAAKSAVMPFTDVKAGSYYYDAVLWAVENGITKGTSDTTFSPDATCSRAQIVTFLWRANGSPAVSGNSAFTDVASDAYYAAAVTWAEKNDVTGGIGGGLFGSNNNCTRAQIVTFIYRSVK